MGQGLGSVLDGLGAVVGVRSATTWSASQGAGLPDFRIHAESPSGDGSKCILCGPIADMTPKQFWGLFGKALRREDVERPPCVSYKCTEQPDGGLLVVPTLPSNDGGRISLHIVWHLFPENNQAIGVNYQTDASLSEVFSRIILRAHSDPFVLECKTEVSERRDSGEALKGIMGGVLKSLNSEVRCHADSPSPDGSGRKSVVSDQIHDTVTTPDMFWRQTKEYIKSQAYDILPNGNVVQRISTGWWFGSAFYTKHVFHDKANEVCSYSYGDDGELSEENLDRVSHLRVHRKPFRLEMFTIVPKHTASGEIERLFLIDFLGPVFKHHKELKEAEQNSLVNEKEEIAMMRKEMQAYQQEMTSAIQALRNDVVALREKAKAAEES